MAWGGGVTDSLEIPRGYFSVYWYDRGPTTPEGLERAIKEYERTGDASALQYLTKKNYGPFFEANYWGTGMPK